MARTDVLVRLPGVAGEAEAREVAASLGEQAGILAARPLAHAGGRLLHVDYRPGVLRPSGVIALLRSLGREGRMAAL
jgi:hypothetical protein